MFKYIILGLVLVAAASIFIGSYHLFRTAQKNKKEMAPYQGEEVPVHANFGKSLVIFYSLSGNTKDIARRIQEKTGADMYEIETVEPITQTPSFYLDSRRQLKNGKYPEISRNFPDFAQYDFIFFGFPVWWYTVATPALAFLEGADFSGKPVAVFSTQGSNPGTSHDDFARKARNAQIVSNALFNNLPETYSKAVNNKIAQWLNNIKQ